MMQKVNICGVNTAGLPLLSAKEQTELMVKLKAGDNQAREKFIVGNMRLVLSLVKRFWSKNSNADDVFQAGCVGLLKAIDNFDLSVGVKFSTYAVPMILGEIKRFIRDGNSLRVSRSIRDTAYRILKVREELEEKEDGVTYDKIAKQMNIAVSEVAYALDAISDPISLYDPVYNKAGDTLLLMDQIFDEKNNDEAWTEKAALYEAMQKLDSREKHILYLRYFEGKTQTEISGQVGISQAQVSRVAGADLWEELMARAGKEGTPVFLVGGKPEVLAQTEAKLRNQWNVNIVGSQDGYFKPEQRQALFERIHASGAQIVTVAMGSPKQEIFMRDCRLVHPDALYMGVGGTYDVFTGHVKRAPKIWQTLGLEWLYRLLSQPSRIKRQLRLLRYLRWHYTGNL